MSTKKFRGKENLNVDYDRNPEYTQEDDDFIMGLGFLLAAEDSLPAVVNTERVELVEFVCEMIRKVVCGENVEVTKELHEPFRSCGSVTILADRIDVYNPRLFVRLLEMGENIDVVPRWVDGVHRKVQLDLSFNGLTTRTRRYE